jgi:prepilin-type N-terminal cleavage/methylation domain-containing protein
MRRSAFTLIELLIAMTVLCLLMSLLAPIIPITKRYADTTNSGALLRKIDTALRLFKIDVRVCPWDGCLQPRLLSGNIANPDWDQNYPGLASASPDWSNRLFRHLGRQLPGAAVAAVLADADAATACFAYDLTNADGKITSKREEVPGRYGLHAFLTTDSLPYGFSLVSGVWKPSMNDGTALAATLNRMAQERYALAMLAGAIDITGPATQTVTSPSGTVYSSANPQAATRASTAIVASPASAIDPGWGDDYLRGELRPADVRDEAIVDAWGSPLVYVCRVLPGCQPAADSNPFNGTAISFLDPELYGLGRDGRTPLVAYDPVKKRPLTAHTTRLPDPADLLRSDIRYYAGAAYAMEFELWSAGHDRRFAWMRDDQLNRDNISARPYLTGLQ